MANGDLSEVAKILHLHKDQESPMKTRENWSYKVVLRENATPNYSAKPRRSGDLLQADKQ